MKEFEIADYATQFNLHPASDPLGDSHHSDMPVTEHDVKIGEFLAWFLGDTFLDSREAPTTQWALIVKALRIHGLKIADEDK